MIYGSFPNPFLLADLIPFIWPPLSDKTGCSFILAKARGLDFSEIIIDCGRLCFSPAHSADMYTTPPKTYIAGASMMIGVSKQKRVLVSQPVAVRMVRDTTCMTSEHACDLTGKTGFDDRGLSRDF